MKTEKRQIEDLAERLDGASFCETNPRYANDLTKAAEYLRLLSSKMCGQGYICPGGEKCDSDHK